MTHKPKIEATPRGEFYKVTCGPCPNCTKNTEFTLTVSDVLAWTGGKKIQHSMPYLTPMERETLISGVCSQKCWDEIFSDIHEEALDKDEIVWP